MAYDFCRYRVDMRKTFRGSRRGVRKNFADSIVRSPEKRVFSTARMINSLIILVAKSLWYSFRLLLRK